MRLVAAYLKACTTETVLLVSAFTPTFPTARRKYCNYSHMYLAHRSISATDGSSRTYELSRYTNQCTAIQIFPRTRAVSNPPPPESRPDLGQICSDFLILRATSSFTGESSMPLADGPHATNGSFAAYNTARYNRSASCRRVPISNLDFQARVLETFRSVAHGSTPKQMNQKNRSKVRLVRAILCICRRFLNRLFGSRQRRSRSISEVAYSMRVL
jgi:hypothetical protein